MAQVASELISITNNEKLTDSKYIKDLGLGDKKQSDINKDSLSGGVYNVTKLHQRQSGYYELSTAIAEVPQALRSVGMVITYQTGENSWDTKQFKGVLSGWTDISKWEDFGGGEAGSSIAEKVEELKEILSPKRELNKDSLTEVGFYVKYSDGNLYENGNYCATDYIEIENGYSSIIINTLCESNSGVAFYTAFKSYISGFGNINGERELTSIPANAKYLRISCKNTAKDNFKVEITFPDINQKVGELDNDVSEITGEVLDIKNNLVEVGKTRHAYFDFAISDENGNVLLLLAGGDIFTKNFNSRIITNNTWWKNKNLSILGDSISTYSGYAPSDKDEYEGENYVSRYPNGDVQSNRQMWWQIVADYLEMNILQIASWSGSAVTGDSSSTTNAFCAASTKRISDLSYKGTSPDVIVIYIGINDIRLNHRLDNSNEESFSFKREIPQDGTIADFTSGYLIMINKIINTYPNARIFCCTLLPTAIGVTTEYPLTLTSPRQEAFEDYNNRIREICDYFGIVCVDIAKSIVNAKNLSTYLPDSLHPNALGQNIMAQKIISTIKSE